MQITTTPDPNSDPKTQIRICRSPLRRIRIRIPRPKSEYADQHYAGSESGFAAPIPSDPDSRLDERTNILMGLYLQFQFSPGFTVHTLDTDPQPSLRRIRIPGWAPTTPAVC